VSIFLTDRTIAPDHLARELEDRGFDALFVPEHTHIPVARRTPYPMGGELPDEYARTYDPFVALTAATAVTDRLRLGIGVCLVAQHDPIVLAKQVASLDLISGGRFTFGIGYGWNIEEMEDHGVDPKRRRGLVREKVLAMQQLWSEDEASYGGERVHFEPAWSWPKPVQRPWPPILIGAPGGPTLFRRVAGFADGWMPIGGGVRAHLPALRAAFEDAGRDPATAQVIVSAARPDPGPLDHFAELGVAAALLFLPSAPPDTVLPLLDRYAELLPKVR